MILFYPSLTLYHESVFELYVVKIHNGLVTLGQGKSRHYEDV